MRFDVTRHLGSFSVKPSTPPSISSCFVSCAFSKALLSFSAWSFCATLVGVAP